MRKYLEETNGNYPSKQSKDDKRQDRWKKQRETYGFDDRDTWNLDITMVELLYERLRMFEEVAPTTNLETIIPTKQGDYSKQEVLDNLLEKSRKAIRLFHNAENTSEEAQIQILLAEIWELWAQVQGSFWW